MSFTVQQIAGIGGTLTQVSIDNSTLKDVSIDSSDVTNLPAPVNPGDAATKQYVDTFNASVTNTLAAPVVMNTNANFTGPSCAQGSAGTWLAIGTVAMQDNTGAAGLSAFLSDGTTNLTTISGVTPAANVTTQVTVIGVFSSPAGNIRILCNDGNGSPNGRINAGSTLTVIKIGD